MEEKKLLFLYPSEAIFDFEIENHKRGYRGDFRKKYKITLNKCIEERYRQRGFEICWAVLNWEPISEIIDRREEDIIVNAGTSYVEASPIILRQLESVSSIVIAGFHIWSCVQKAARAAYERGIKTLVDEDLTEFFGFRIKQREFRTEVYPGCNPVKGMKDYMIENFREARMDMPWMIQI